MNTIIAKISTLSHLDNLNILECATTSDTLIMMSLDLSSRITKGSRVKLAVKPTNIILTKNLSGLLSCENNFEAKVTHIDKGELLCSVTLEYLDTNIEAIISLNAANTLSLKTGETLRLLIKASDIYIQEILDV